MDNLSRTVEQFWAIESYGTVGKNSISIKPLQEHIENTVEYKNNIHCRKFMERKSAIITIQQRISLIKS